MHRIRIGDENGDSNRSGHALKSPLGMSSGRVFVISENNTERGVGDTNRTCGGTSNESYSIIEEDPLDSEGAREMGQVRYTIDRNHILFERDTKDKALFQKIRTQAQRQLNDWASPTSVSSYHSEEPPTSLTSSSRIVPRIIPFEEVSSHQQAKNINSKGRGIETDPSPSMDQVSSESMEEPGRMYAHTMSEISNPNVNVPPLRLYEGGMRESLGGGIQSSTFSGFGGRGGIKDVKDVKGRDLRDTRERRKEKRKKKRRQVMVKYKNNRDGRGEGVEGMEGIEGEGEHHLEHGEYQGEYLEHNQEHNQEHNPHNQEVLHPHPPHPPRQSPKWGGESESDMIYTEESESNGEMYQTGYTNNTGGLSLSSPLASPNILHKNFYFIQDDQGVGSELHRASYDLQSHRTKSHRWTSTLKPEMLQKELGNFGDRELSGRGQKSMTLKNLGNLGLHGELQEDYLKSSYEDSYRLHRSRHHHLIPQPKHHHHLHNYGEHFYTETSGREGVDSEREMHFLLENMTFENKQFKKLIQIKNEQMLVLERKGMEQETSIEGMKKEIGKCKEELSALIEHNEMLLLQLELYTRDDNKHSMGVNTSLLSSGVDTSTSTAHSMDYSDTSTSTADLQEDDKQVLNDLNEQLVDINNKLTQCELQNLKLMETHDHDATLITDTQLENRELLTQLRDQDKQKNCIAMELDSHKEYLADINDEIKETRLKLHRMLEENNYLVDENKRLYNNLCKVNSDANTAPSETSPPSDFKELKQKVQNYEELSMHMAKEVETQKLMLSQNQHKITDTLKHMEDYKTECYKKSAKIKDLKKERDLLKIEILKLKQIYSEKCDNYKEIRNKLHKKLKQKDDIIYNLKKELGMGSINRKGHHVHNTNKNVENLFKIIKEGHNESNPNYQEILDVIKKESKFRSKSLENTGKIFLGGLGATQRKEDFNNMLNTKLEELATSHGEDDEINQSNIEFKRTEYLGGVFDIGGITDKSKSFYSDDSNILFEAKNIIDQGDSQSHNITNTSISKIDYEPNLITTTPSNNPNRYDNLEEKIYYLKQRRLEIESKLKKNDQYSKQTTPLKNNYIEKTPISTKNQAETSMHSDTHSIQHASNSLYDPNNSRIFSSGTEAANSSFQLNRKDDPIPKPWTIDKKKEEKDNKKYSHKPPMSKKEERYEVTKRRDMTPPVVGRVLGMGGMSSSEKHFVYSQSPRTNPKLSPHTNDPHIRPLGFEEDIIPSTTHCRLQFTGVGGGMNMNMNSNMGNMNNNMGNMNIGNNMRNISNNIRNEGRSNIERYSGEIFERKRSGKSEIGSSPRDKRFVGTTQGKEGEELERNMQRMKEKYYPHSEVNMGRGKSKGMGMGVGVGSQGIQGAPHPTHTGHRERATVESTLNSSSQTTSSGMQYHGLNKRTTQEDRSVSANRAANYTTKLPMQHISAHGGGHLYKYDNKSGSGEHTQPHTQPHTHPHTHPHPQAQSHTQPHPGHHQNVHQYQQIHQAGIGGERSLKARREPRRHPPPQTHPQGDPTWGGYQHIYNKYVHKHNTHNHDQYY